MTWWPLPADMTRGAGFSEAGALIFSRQPEAARCQRKTIHSALNMAWSHADIDGKHPGKIRVYSLRHQFASACLNRWLDNGENLMAMLPFLREYMGHKNLSETAYYIHILPENLIKSPAIDWDKFNAMFQEVEK